MQKQPETRVFVLALMSAQKGQMVAEAIRASNGQGIWIDVCPVSSLEAAVRAHSDAGPAHVILHDDDHATGWRGYRYLFSGYFRFFRKNKFC
jgi:hypothetical protein